MAHPLVPKVEEKVKSSKVVIFMKGTPQFPQCGFSSRAVQVLKAAGATVWNVIVGDEPGDSICLISDTALDPGVVAQKFGKQVEIRRSETWSTRSAR